MSSHDATVLPFPTAKGDGSPPPPEEPPVKRLDPRRFVGRNLTGQDLSNLDLRGLDFTDANLTGAILTRSDLSGACLFRARLDEADFTGARLVGADLREVVGTRCGFGGANLAGADLTASELSHAAFTHADLSGAIAVDADLTRARLVKTDLSRADLHRARLEHATLAQCDVAEASFRDATFRHGRIAHVRNYDRADWVGVDLRDIDPSGAYDLRRFAHDQNYLEEFYAHSRWNQVLYFVWWVSSDCGRSMGRWAAWVGILAGAYGLLYTFLPIDYGAHPTALSPLYFSVVTMTSLGFGDALPTDVWSQLAVMSEVLCGYAMLGGLLAILSNKMARRAD